MNDPNSYCHGDKLFLKSLSHRQCSGARHQFTRQKYSSLFLETFLWADVTCVVNAIHFYCADARTNFNNKAMRLRNQIILFIRIGHERIFSPLRYLSKNTTLKSDHISTPCRSNDINRVQDLHR